jgi:oligopeptide transport system permease protein
MMSGYVLKRLLQVIPLLLVIMTITFFIMRLAPGNPFANERQLSEVVQRNMNRRFGLDRPMFYFSIVRFEDAPAAAPSGDGEGPAAPGAEAASAEDRSDPERAWHFTLPRWNGLDNQYHNNFFWRDVKDEESGEVVREWGVIGGNFGPSTRFTDARSVAEMIWTGLPVSLSLGLAAYLIALVVGIPIGVLAAYKQNSAVDYVSMAGAMIGISIPALVMAPVLILVFALTLYIFPPALMEWVSVGPYSFPNPRFLLLPALSLAAVYAAYIARLTRAGMLETLRADYVRTARAKGLKETAVVVRHALRGALLPVVSFTGPALALLLGGAIVVERVFALGGLGRFFIEAANNRDYTLTLGIVFFVSVVLILMNLLVDIAYAYIDPRIKYH